MLSRTRGNFVKRLFESEIPEIGDGVILINAIAREAGYRSKVAVSSIDSKVDCVGACVGVRGNRIKVIIDELAGERIDIVRYDEDPQVLIPNSLQPAEVDEVILCAMMGRAIVLVRDDQLSLAIGKRGQNVRLGSKLCGWDIEIMTQTELESQIDRAVRGFCEIDGVDEDLANRLVGEGYLSYDDLEVIEPSNLMEMGELSEEDVDKIVEQAEVRALEAEKRSAEEKRVRKEQEIIRKATEAAEAKKAAEAEAIAKLAAQAEAEAKAGEADAGDSASETTDATESAAGSNEESDPQEAS